MIPMSADAKTWLATGVTDIRRGFNGLAAQTEQVLAADPYTGHLFLLHGRRGDQIKMISLSWFVSSLGLSRFCAAPRAGLGHLPFESDRAFPTQC
jgi:transposase